MKNQYRIIQTNILIESKDGDNHMVLAFVLNNRVVATHTLIYPKWYKFYDERFKYYLFSDN